MSANPREHFGSNYTLTVVEKGVEIQTVAKRMLITLLDEMDANGSFNFISEAKLSPLQEGAKPRMSVHAIGSKLMVSMFWGSGPEDSLTGSLFPPKNMKPVELQKAMRRPLEYLNGDGWPDLERDGASLPAASAAVHPLQVVQRSEVPKKSAPELISDEELALALFKKAGQNAILSNSRVTHHLAYHYSQPNHHASVKETMVRLGLKGYTRRVVIDAGNSKWQFTEAFLDAHGLKVADYEPLPEVHVVHRLHQPSAANTAAVTGVPAVPTVVSAPAPPEPEHPGVKKLAELYAESDRLKAERPQFVAALETAQQALSSMDAKLDALQAEIISVTDSLTKEELLSLVLHRKC